jgi:hypothetical protein
MKGFLWPQLIRNSERRNKREKQEREKRTGEEQEYDIKWGIVSFDTKIIASTVKCVFCLSNMSIQYSETCFPHTYEHRWFSATCYADTYENKYK